MTFHDFKVWFAAFDATQAGKAPELKQWWELKARLEAVESPETMPLLTEKRLVSRETEITDLDPLPDVDLSSFSDDKDGGLTALAVRLHRSSARRTPRSQCDDR